MDDDAAPTCPSCKAELTRLGGSRTQHGSQPPVEIVHYQCESCGKRWVHTAKGFRVTDRELTD
jgi:transposase-like protein